MNLRQLLDRGTALSRQRLAARVLPVGIAATALTVAGSFTPWATFSGYPGKASLAGFPGGARIFTLLLAIGMVAALLRPVGGRRRAGLLCAAGIVAISLANAWSITGQGGGLVNVAYGVWLAAVGGALGVAAFAALPDDEPVALRPHWPRAVEYALLAGVVGLGLYAVVVALAIGEPSRFLSYLVFLGFAVSAASAVGAMALLPKLYNRHQPVALGLILLAGIAFPFTQNGNATWLRVAATIGTLTVAAIGLNIVVGLAGLLDLGYIAFFGVGAYVGGIFSGAGRSSIHVHLPFLVVMLLAALIAGTFGLIIGAPTLRLRGDYLAIVTLAFGEIFRIVANNLDGTAGPNVTRGPNGISGIPDLKIGALDIGAPHTVFGVDLPYFANYYFLELLMLVIVMVIFSRLNASRIGRAWVAIREDETAAAAMGINTIKLKLLAFAIGACLAGAAGSMSAHVGTQVSPESFTFIESVLLLAAVVLGGMGTIPGALLGASALAIIPEKLRFLQDKRLLVFGIALILMMRFRPEGIVPNKRRRREFHDETGGGDAMSAAPGGPVAT
ncbi:MAG: branched-chain amino acid ABC transporter permease [Actinomycetota bacterium]